MLDEFTALIRQHDVARTNRFIVTIPVPKKLQQFSAIPRDYLRLLCTTVSGIAEVNFAHDGESLGSGPSRQTPYRINDPSPTNMIFTIDGGFNVKHFFDAWAFEMVDQKKFEVAFFDDIKTDIIVEILDRADAPRYAIKLKECTLNSAGFTQALSSGPGEVLEASVTFKYRYWEPTAPVTTAKSLEIKGPFDNLNSAWSNIKPYLASVPKLGKIIGKIDQTTGIGKQIGRSFGILK